MFGQEEGRWITFPFSHKTQRMLSDELKLIQPHPGSGYVSWCNYDAFMGSMCFLFCLKADALEVTKYCGNWTIWLQQTQAAFYAPLRNFWDILMSGITTFCSNQIICWWKNIQKSKIRIGRGARQNVYSWQEFVWAPSALSVNESWSTVIMTPRKHHLWNWSLKD